MNACLAMSCLQEICCHIGPSELKAVALQLKLCSMKWFPAHSSAATDQSQDWASSCLLSGSRGP